MRKWLGVMLCSVLLGTAGLHDQFGIKKRIPRNFGKQITFTRYFKAASGANMSLPSKVNDGTIIGLSAISATQITAYISGYASAVGVSDFIVMTAVSDIVKGAVFELSKGMALKIDQLIRAAISATGQQLPAKNTLATASNTIQTTSLLRAQDMYRAAAKLRQSDARTWPDGCYAAVLHPKPAFDVRSDTSTGGWVDINKYATNQTVDLLYRGEVGKIGGVRIVESSDGKQLFGATAAGSGISAAASGFSSIVIGPGAYGVVELDGAAASVFVKQVGSSGVYDPVNQKGSVGVKVYFTPAVLEAARMVRVCSGGRTI